MRILKQTNRGFTLIEVLIAGGIMIILCVGTLAVFSHASKINTGNNLRAQAQSVLQEEIEYFRSLRYVPAQTDPLLTQGTKNLPARTSADGKVFTMTANVTNIFPASSNDANCTLKQIVITAVPAVAPTDNWLSDLNTKVTIQRVRSN